MVRIQEIERVSGGVVLHEQLVNRLLDILTQHSSLIVKNEMLKKDRDNFDTGATYRDCRSFMVDGYPNFVFKIDNISLANGSRTTAQARWESIKHADSTIREENLDRVTLLPQSLFKYDDEKFVIAEDRSQLARTWHLDANAYYSTGNEITPALEQLATFIIRNGLKNTPLKNIPLLYDENGALEPSPRITVLDVEGCEDALARDVETVSKYTRLMVDKALFGDSNFGGLFGHVHKNQLEAILTAAEKAGFDVGKHLPGELSAAKQKSQKRDERRHKLQAVSTKAAVFDEKAREIIAAIASVSGEKFGEVTTLPFQRTAFEWATRAFKCGDISGTIMLNEHNGLDAWVVHLPHRFENCLSILPTFGYAKEVTEPASNGSRMILFKKKDIDSDVLSEFAMDYEVHGPEFRYVAL
ncbi:hypothetical protein VFPPC_08619 [Pochonia chlamydosporia 170]|uniref:Uncharacterized protein n=1 Tax=Pochonia chlamydosporia 170 TaxID=1380566 RepID=A0A179FNI1_METCM|nr:hypothetical protein VFPPC_08619 [Pochonia chlamydosporia 170]OAQ67176.1 hypothetical protein VFPPC_08619 [Pochonia chlamydosporia 170]